LNTINHCRFCRMDNFKTPLFKYGVRHYACAPCGLNNFPNGRAFLDKLPVHQIERMPFVALRNAGFSLDDIKQYCLARRAAGQEGRAA
jgi:hypothetical protein